MTDISCADSALPVISRKAEIDSTRNEPNRTHHRLTADGEIPAIDFNGATPIDLLRQPFFHSPDSPSRIYHLFIPKSIRSRLRARSRMLTETQRLNDLPAIRQFVTETLCEKDRLEVNFFPLSEKILVRGGAPCGLYFCLHGPRSLRLTAIWETDSNTILFYGSRGERFRRTQLVGPPCIDDAMSLSS